MRNRLKKIIKRVLSEVRRENQAEIDRILDKINDVGMDSLTRSERMMLKSGEKENYSPQIEIIDMINQKMVDCGIIFQHEFGLDYPIVLKDSSEGIHIIEAIHADGVDVVVYGGYKNETELEEYELPFEEINNDVLEEILSIVEGIDC